MVLGLVMMMVGWMLCMPPRIACMPIVHLVNGLHFIIKRLPFGPFIVFWTVFELIRRGHHLSVVVLVRLVAFKLVLVLFLLVFRPLPPLRVPVFIVSFIFKLACWVWVVRRMSVLSPLLL